MRLADWRIGSGRTQDMLASELRVDAATIHRWERGTRTPGRDHLQAIFLLSEGQVEPNDFYDMPAWRRILAHAIQTMCGRAA